MISRRRGSDRGEDARSDDGADPERDQIPRTERFAELVALFMRLGDELIERLRAEELPED